MADNATPDETGTTDEEQQENNDAAQPEDNEVPVVVGEPEDEQEPEDEPQDMAEELQEVQEILEMLAEDPDNVAVLALTAVTKQEFETPDGEQGRGVQWRVVNFDLEDYDDLQHVLSMVMRFNSNAEDLKLPVERQKSPLAGLLG